MCSIFSYRKEAGLALGKARIKCPGLNKARDSAFHRKQLFFVIAGQSPHLFSAKISR